MNHVKKIIYGMYAPEPGDFLFSTEYVPIGLLAYTIGRDSLMEYAVKVRGIFQNEIKSIKES